MNSNLNVAVVTVEKTKREQLAEGLNRLAIAAGIAYSARMLAEQHEAPNVSVLASVCESILQDAHEAAISHAADGDDIDLADALGLIGGATKVSNSLMDAIRVMSTPWGSQIFENANAVSLVVAK